MVKFTLVNSKMDCSMVRGLTLIQMELFTLENGKRQSIMVMVLRSSRMVRGLLGTIIRVLRRAMESLLLQMDQLTRETLLTTTWMGKVSIDGQMEDITEDSGKRT